MKNKKSKKKGFVEGHDTSVGRGNFANLPSEVIQKSYPRSPKLRGGVLDDTITGIDDVNSQCESMTMKHLSNQK